MKLAVWLLIFALCLLAVEAIPATRDFTLPPDQPKISGYAEVRLDRSLHGKRSFMEARIWFQGRSKWRVESKTNLPPQTYYQMCAGRYSYAGLPSKSGRVRWISFPSACFPPDLDLYFPHRSSPSSPKLVGHGRMHGLPVENWQGINHFKTGDATYKVWVSTDPRFPLVLKTESKSSKASMVWSITKLDLTSPVPDYIFTEQVVPKPGFLRLLLLPHRSPLITVLWNALIMLAYAGILFPLAWRANGNQLGLRVAAAAASTVVWSFLIVESPKLEAYFLTFWGLPVFIGIALVSFALVFVSLRVIGLPTGASVFKGTTWAVSLMVPVAAVLGGLSQYPFGKHWLSFVHGSFQIAPPALIGSVLIATGFAAVEELLFRGYLFSALVPRFKSAYSVILVQAVIFAAYHVPGSLQLTETSLHFMVQIAWMAVFGIFFGVLRLRYRNLGVPWLVHAGFNTGYIFLFYSSLTGILNAHL